MCVVGGGGGGGVGGEDGGGGKTGKTMLGRGGSSFLKIINMFK